MPPENEWEIPDIKWELKRPDEIVKEIEELIDTLRRSRVEYDDEEMFNRNKIKEKLRGKPLDDDCKRAFSTRISHDVVVCNGLGLNKKCDECGAFVGTYCKLKKMEMMENHED